MPVNENIRPIFRAGSAVSHFSEKQCQTALNGDFLISSFKILIVEAEALREWIDTGRFLFLAISICNLNSSSCEKVSRGASHGAGVEKSSPHSPIAFTFGWADIL